MITTTQSIDGKRIKEYIALVAGDAIIGTSIFRDIFARITDIVGGRTATYERELVRARKLAIDEMVHTAKDLEADAIVGVSLSYEVIGDSMLMVCVVGTAVRFEN